MKTNIAYYNPYNNHKINPDTISSNLNKRGSHTNKIGNLKVKINYIENNLSTLRYQMNKLTQNIDALLKTKNVQNEYNMNKLDECKKLIKSFSNNSYNYNPDVNFNPKLGNPNLNNNLYLMV
jgi:seryl-tRNA synthetase